MCTCVNQCTNAQAEQLAVAILSPAHMSPSTKNSLAVCIVDAHVHVYTHTETSRWDALAGTEVGRVEIRPPRSVDETNTKCCETGYTACQQIHEGVYWKSLSCSLWHSAESLDSPPLDHLLSNKSLQWFSRCGRGPWRFPGCFQGTTGQKYFHNNVKACFSFLVISWVYGGDFQRLHRMWWPHHYGIRAPVL